MTLFTSSSFAHPPPPSLDSRTIWFPLPVDWLVSPLPPTVTCAWWCAASRRWTVKLWPAPCWASSGKIRKPATSSSRWSGAEGGRSFSSSSCGLGLPPPVCVCVCVHEKERVVPDYCFKVLSVGLIFLFFCFLFRRHHRLLSSCPIQDLNVVLNGKKEATCFNFLNFLFF